MPLEQLARAAPSNTSSPVNSDLSMGILGLSQFGYIVPLLATAGEREALARPFPTLSYEKINRKLDAAAIENFRVKVL